MCIRSYHRHFVLCDIEEDTVHHRTEVIIGRSEDRLLDRALKYVSRDSQLTRTHLCTRHLRILVAVHADKRIGTVLADHVHRKIILVDGESQRLLAELLEGL